MTIGGDITAALPAIQQQSDSLNTDTFAVTRPDPDDPGTWDPVTGETTPGTITVHADLPGRLRSPSAAERQQTAGEHQWSMSDVVWRVAASTTGIKLGDKVTCTASPQGVNVGGEFTVMYALTGSHVSAARFIVRRVDA